MKRARVRFYAELNDWLPPERRGRPFEYTFYTELPAREVIESSGVPHTEVDLVLVNGDSVGFEYPVHDGDLVSVYPVFESFDISPVLKVRPAPLRVVRFVLDAHLGRLAAYLRMLGFDSVYRNDWDDAELAAVSMNDHRILLTRDRGLLKRSAVTHGRYVLETNLRKQLLEVLERFDLFGSVQPFTRCLACNDQVVEAAKDDVGARLPPRVADKHDRFWQCPNCSRVYWEGSHHRRMRQLMDQVLTRAYPFQT